jgi:Phage tail sheath C-terminal domain
LQGELTMALTSPGVEVTVINESFYVPANAGATPLIIVASSQDKLNGAGTATAPGTKTANANSVYLISSQRELTETFGDPKFYTDASGNSLNGYELNEYGLQAAYSFLGIANRAFVLRANVDLSQLNGSATPPSTNPSNGAYWFDLSATVSGLLEFSSSAQTFTAIDPIYITSTNDLIGGVYTGTPKSSIGKKGDYAINTTANENNIYWKDSTNTWLQLGSTAWRNSTGDSSQKLFQQSSHVNRPLWKTVDGGSAPTGSVWFKTTTPNAGANLVFKKYNSSTATWSVLNAPLYPLGSKALFALDPINGGLDIAPGTLYVQYNVTEASPALGNFTPFRYKGGKTVITSKKTSPSFKIGDTIKIKETLKGTSDTSSEKTITINGTTADDFVAAISAGGFTNITARVLDSGAIQITHELGGIIRFIDGFSIDGSTLGTALADAGFGIADANDYGHYSQYAPENTTKVENLYIKPEAGNHITASNWQGLVYTPSYTEARNEAKDSTLWYNTLLEADILKHNGTTWVGYKNALASTDANGPQFSATEPTTQSNGDALVVGDLWIDTSDLENYPRIYRYDGSMFVLIDNTDQTTEEGIVFADARWSGAGDDIEPDSIKKLLTYNYLDPDAPNPALYPKGILLFNTRRSGYNVKEYKKNYINLPGYNPDRWVTKNANNENGSGTFGRKAVRKTIVQQLKAEINTNQAIREDQRGFNIIACPGYPEVISELVNLNTDRNNTAFVIGDTPLRLEGTSTAISNWANNTAGATDNSDEGLVTSSDYLGVFYPAGRTTDNLGDTIVVPSSHMILRVLANNDNVAFPWFAPAGTRRGIVDNATSVGYINSTTGEFQQISLTQSVRDSMFTAKVNPITFFSGTGILNFGNLTKTSNSSALDRINVSRLTVYLRAQLDKIAKPFIFEPNDALTRNEIKGAIESFLLELVGQRALYDFLVVCDDSNNTATRIDRNELYVDIAIEPVKSVEFIYIPLRIKNTGEIAKLGV